jgi:hypothetical protein
MRFPQSLLILGVLLGSSIVALFGYVIAAGAAPLPVTGAAALSQAQAPAEAAAPSPYPGPEAAQQAEEAAVEHTALTGEAEGCGISDRFPQSIQQWCDLITRYALESGLEPDLVASVMLQESGGDPVAYSKSGAVGLMQVMPRDGIAAKFNCINGPCFASRPSIAELENPEFNIEYGTGMIAGLLGRYGDIRDALKAYGPMDVGYYYADKVLAIFENHQ